MCNVRYNQFIDLFLAVVVVIVLPGPNSLYCLSVSASHGYTAGLRAIAGVLLGDLILIMATVLVWVPY